MLAHTECPRSALEVDPSKAPVISGTDLWYHIRCTSCWAQLGLLANVEDIWPALKPGQLEREEQYKLSKPQSH